MQAIMTIGLVIAKSVFQVHCFDAASQVVIRRQLKRRYFLTFFVGALSVSGAIFLILEMDQPFAGLMQISSEPLRHALAPLPP
jgi:hypothetical protein